MSELQLVSPSRLHFGLLSFNNPNVPQFGGLGMMINEPNLVVRARHSETFGVRGTHADRVEQFATVWSKFNNRPGLPPVEFEVVSAPRQHVGLGLGTQLGLSVGRLLTSLLLDRSIPIDELATSVSRGKRSSIGTFGFDSGGFLFELGKPSGEVLATEKTRVDLPEHWRIVLITRKSDAGLSGKSEQSAFDKLPPVPKDTTAQLNSLATDIILPSASEHRFAEFSDALFRYGEKAGSCFASLQGGSFADKDLEKRIMRIRESGIMGVGQSSWGPTIFTFHENESAASDFVREASKDSIFNNCDIIITTANHTGHQISTVG